jgi:UDP-glucose 4-epimerase
MRILVTGGAGYIGSVVSEQLVASGHDVTVFDSLKSGHKSSIHPNAKLVQGNLLNPSDLNTAFDEVLPEAICHLAAEIAVGESMTDPGLHYQNNLVGGLNLADAMVSHGVKKIVFSSTAAVYGYPDEIPISESAQKKPVNVYGETKLAFERALRWYGEIHGIRHISLRYFNACGASDRCGEFRERESHIIPLLLEVALAKRSQFSIFGTDYPTPDGTCVRDYIHVEDIAQAHILALNALSDIESDAFNIGIGTGSSNRQVVEAVRQATGHPIPTIETERRAGDPPTLIAKADRIRTDLGWKPKFTDLQSMVDSAWAWRKQHPEGYSN